MGNERTITSSARLSVRDWDAVKPGQTVTIRYSIQDPQTHTVYLDEYVSNIETLTIFGWLFTILAGLFLLFDIRRQIPATYGIAGTAAYYMLSLGLLSIMIAGTMRWNMLRTIAGFEVTAGVVARKTSEPARQATNDAARAGAPRHVLTYTFTPRDGGPIEASREVEKQFFDNHQTGKKVLVVCAFHNPSGHHLRSGADLDAADGFIILGALMAFLGGVIFLLRHFIFPHPGNTAPGGQ